jgi:hypothetical protein
MIKVQVPGMIFCIKLIGYTMEHAIELTAFMHENDCGLRDQILD